MEDSPFVADEACNIYIFLTLVSFIEIDLRGNNAWFYITNKPATKQTCEVIVVGGIKACVAIRPVWQVTYVTFSSSLAKKNSGRALYGNRSVWRGRRDLQQQLKKQKQEQSNFVIDLCGSSAWNAPCVAKK